MIALGDGRRRGYETIEEGAPTEFGARTERRVSRVGLAAVLFLGIAIALGIATRAPRAATAHADDVIGPAGADADAEFSPTEEPTAGGRRHALLDSRGRFIMRNFDSVKPMSSFLAGIGGMWGLPMWAFYVNRGQGLASFGIKNKDGSIQQFRTANVAYQETPSTGFRTILSVQRMSSEHVLGDATTYQPFFGEAAEDTARDMYIGKNELEIVEKSTEQGIETRVLYFTLPNEDFPALARRTTLVNHGTDTLRIACLDGLAKLIPFGISSGELTTMGRTMEAWMNVYNVEADTTAPFFHVSQKTGDIAQVEPVVEGHFAVAFVDGSDRGLLPFVLDPEALFGMDTTLSVPEGLAQAGSAAELVGSDQCFSARTPCALAAVDVVLAPGENVTICSIYGHAEELSEFTESILPVLTAEGFVSQKHAEASELADFLTENVDSSTAWPLFDAYVEMNYLDNVLRGGLPLILGDPEEPVPGLAHKVYHTFSRIHGDLERDYNNFNLDLTYFSQGPGNFRDVNQNRRADVLQEPRVGDFNVRTFLSITQLDGYNPLTVATAMFTIPEEDLDGIVQRIGAVGNATAPEALRHMLRKPFRVGALFEALRKNDVQLPPSMPREEFLRVVASAARQTPTAQYAQNGFWADHWTYDQDLVDNFLAVYPEREEWLLLDAPRVPSYASPSVVNPRALRYVADAKTGKVFQYHAVSDAIFCPKHREEMLEELWSSSAYVGDPTAGAAWHLYESGGAVKMAIGAKLALLAVLKASTLDALAVGVEMEGGKPGWNDAMNGLPGLLGSGTPEASECLRLVRYLRGAMERHGGRSLSFPAVVADFFDDVGAAMEQYASRGAEHKANASALEGLEEVPRADFELWDALSAAREAYRAQIVGKVADGEVELSCEKVSKLLKKLEARLLEGRERALSLGERAGGIVPTYLSYDAAAYEDASVDGVAERGGASVRGVRITKLRMPEVLPLFLEGPTRLLKTLDGAEEKRRLHERVQRSELYDEELQMYKISASLKELPQSVGRMVAFPAGWLENESIWMHMSFKYYLELLRAGLYEDFFGAIATGMPPYMDVKRYGRSPLEASSFIASSAFPDAKLHGQGFLARLSGSTAEFLSMYNLMMAGPSPFALDDAGDLRLQLRPIIPSDFFKEDGTLSFRFLGTINVTYFNEKGLNTWDAEPGKVCVVLKNDTDTHVHFSSGVVPKEMALAARDRKVEEIHVHF